MSNSESSVAIGVDIGGTKIMAGCVTRAGHILQTEQVATPSTPTAILEAVGDLCSMLQQTVGKVVGIGIGTAGMVNSASGEVIHANANLPDWTGTRFADLGFADDVLIVAENDVRAMAYAEAILGAGQDYQSVLCITVGTGIGGGLILNGQIWHGANYSAGEIGYLIVDWRDGKPRRFDRFASGRAIEAAFQAQSKRFSGLSLVEISERAAAGNQTARRVIKQKARQFGMILGGYVTSINPQAVVIGGGVPQIGALWWDAMEEAFCESVPPPVKETALILSSLGIEAVLLGAAMLAWKGSET